jgi:hypothetical protein
MLFALGLLALSGCGEAHEAHEAGEVHEAGDAHPAPAAPSAPGTPAPVPAAHDPAHDPAGKAAPAVTPPVAGAHPPFSADAAPAAREPGPRITGTVTLAPQFADKAGSGTLFVIARSKTGGGMPIAVLPAKGAQFPFAFDLGPEHVPLAVDNKAELLSAEVKLYARLSASGQAIGVAGDLESAPQIVSGDGPAVNLVIDTVKQ